MNDKPSFFCVNANSEHVGMQNIVEFHAKFELPPNGDAGFLPPELFGFRLKFMQEELDEYRDAVVRGDLVKAFDALLDLQYVVLGTIYLHNFPFDAGWRAVHEANMKKMRAERAEQSKRGSTFDVVKPPGWVPPEQRLEVLLRRQWERANDVD